MAEQLSHGNPFSQVNLMWTSSLQHYIPNGAVALKDVPQFPMQSMGKS